MLVVPLSRIRSSLVVLILIALLADNGYCTDDEHSRIYMRHYYPPQFRASHSPTYDYIHIPGRRAVFCSSAAVDGVARR